MLELPKLRDALVGMAEPALAAWCRFLAAETDDELEAWAMQHPSLKDAKAALDRLREDPDPRERAERRELELKLYEYGATALRAEGGVEGRTEGKQSALLTLLTTKFGDLPSVIQTRVATATEVDLDFWFKRVAVCRDARRGIQQRRVSAGGRARVWGATGGSGAREPHELTAFQVFSLPGFPIVPARARRLQAAAGAQRRCLLAGARKQPGPGTREPASGRAGVRGQRARKGNMLRIYPVVLEVLKQLQPALRRIEVQDRDLARQLRRASSSIALNLGEGMYSRGQNRQARYHSALGSARETLSCLEVAALSSYVEEDKQLWDQLDRVVGTLVLLSRA